MSAGQCRYCPVQIFGGCGVWNWAGFVDSGVGGWEVGFNWRQALMGGLQSEMQNFQVLHSLLFLCLCSFGFGGLEHGQVCASMGGYVRGRDELARGPDGGLLIRSAGSGGGSGIMLRFGAWRVMMQHLRTPVLTMAVLWSRAESHAHEFVSNKAQLAPGPGCSLQFAFHSCMSSPHRHAGMPVAQQH